MTTTRELIDALVSGDSVAIENTFNAVMSDKVSTALDTYRVDVAQKMFVAPQDQVESDDNVQQA